MNTTKLLAAGCRWTARILGTVLLSMIVILAIGEGMPNLLTQPMRVQIGFLALALIMIGILAGWRWELAGGIISLAGWGLFVGPLQCFERGLNWFVGALALPGALYLAGALLTRLSLPAAGLSVLGESGQRVF